MRSIFAAMAMASGIAGCAIADTPPAASDCRACVNPDSPGCASCLGAPGTPDPNGGSLLAGTTPVQIAITEDNLNFAIIGDTRPAVVNDTAGYPTAVITTIFQDLEALNPRPGFAVATGDYQFSSNGSTETAPQLDKYLAARANFSNPEYPAMGNHECTGATKSNCGPGTTDGSTSIYTTYLSKILAPLGISTPYYSLLITPPDKAWSAKVVLVAANAWTSAQATWLTNVLSQPSTYTFVVRHESTTANTAPGVTPSESIINAHPYTMLIVGHDHTYKRFSQKEVLLGNGGAPLTTGSAFGYGVVSQRSDGAIQFTISNYMTHAMIDSFAVNADGSTATNNPPPPPPPSGTFTLGASPSSVTSNGMPATSTIALTPTSGFSGSAKLTATGVPSGAQATFGVTQLGANQSTTLTLSPGTAAPGTYGIGVSGTIGSEVETSTISWTVASATSCSHDKCSSGGKLVSSCDPCVSQICAVDSFCCATSWNSQCISEVASVCGQNTCSMGGGGTNTCSHAYCSTGSALTNSCASCVTKICSSDSFCCSHSWDSTCVAEVGTICGETCN